MIRFFFASQSKAYFRTTVEHEKAIHSVVYRKNLSLIRLHCRDTLFLTKTNELQECFDVLRSISDF